MTSREAADEESTASEVPLDAVIVVVAFNESYGIEDCLRALLVQETDQTYEVLVVDDGSTDTTSAIVEQLQETDSRLRLIRHDVNRGRGAARRTGQDASSAPHIGFVDADIIVPPDWLQRCSTALSHYSAVSAVPLPDGDAAVIWRIFGAPVRFRVGFSGITGNNVIFDAAVLHLEPFDAQYSLGEDFRLSHRMLRRGYKLKVLEDLSVEHRESKRYGDAIRYMWDTGVDAASHPFQFRIVRLPDLSWTLWLLWCLASLAAALVGSWSWALGALSAIGMTAVVSLAYTFSRFRVRPNPLRWLGSAVGSVPLIVAYLSGRTLGFAALVSPRRRRALDISPT
jgi:glycosyltransferase involved in cell wall biosynthesis